MNNIKVVILAGGGGTRLGELTHTIPKPMIEIGNRPILWHIMKIYNNYDFNKFEICCGYKGNIIKEYFYNYKAKEDFTAYIGHGCNRYHNNSDINWEVSLIDTGENTMTGGRLLRIKHRIKDTFLMTYGDGLSDINIGELIDFHKSHGKIATITAVNPPGRFGVLDIDNNMNVRKFKEKPDSSNWINGGFFVLDPQIFDYLNNSDNTIFEKEPLVNLAKDGELKAYKHKGFWKPMDTMKDKGELQNMWDSGCAPWKIW